MVVHYLVCLAIIIASTVSANAQTVSSPVVAPEQSASDQLSLPFGGTIGQRQTIPPTALNNVPGERVDGRISNRVESRIQNRVDRNYDPLANALSPFKIAGDKSKQRDRP